MYWLVGLMSIAILGLIVSGIGLNMSPGLARRVRRGYSTAMGTKLDAFVDAQLGLLTEERERAGAAFVDARQGALERVDLERELVELGGLLGEPVGQHQLHRVAGGAVAQLDL